MMKLILSLTLIWTLSSTAEALQCLEGRSGDINTCYSAGLCATVVVQINFRGRLTQSTDKLCINHTYISEGKHTFSISVDIGTASLSAHVCNTDRCNSEDIPYPDIHMKNNLQCFTCDDRFPAECDKTIQCVGVEDRCINGTLQYSDEGRNARVLGCASANVCSPFMEFLPPFFHFHAASKCCGSSFCNSAWSVKLNVIPLLFGLITLIVC